MSEPRALAAALSSPAFVTKGGGAALNAADRHVDRWAPEVGATGANRIRPLRNLGFVDRLVSPWIESAQRSASLRMFSQYISTGTAERPTTNTSWLFPRPWYQDELDWMAAARHVNVQAAVSEAPAPSMLTTRGTYVAPPTQASRIALPTQLHEYVAPSLSIARPEVSAGINAYSPLVPMAATHAAHVMTSAIAPLVAAQTRQTGALSPSLRGILTSMLERSARTPIAAEPTRAASHAPELVTPPAPRPDVAVETAVEGTSASAATAIAERYAEQRTRIAELQRIARVTAERDHAARAADTARAPATGEATTRIAEIQQRATEAAARREAEVRQIDARRDAAANTQRLATAETERARLEERIAQRLAERTRQQQDSQRLHETARDAAARDARAAVTMPEMRDTRGTDAAAPVQTRVAGELANAVAALPPELAAMVASSISQRPERAAQAIAELGEALRAVELLARTQANGGTIESSRGPRVVMPAGLGGLVSTVERTVSPAGRAGMRVPAAFAPAPQSMPSAAFAPRAEMTRVPAMTWLAPRSQNAATATPAPTSALGAAMHATPAALHHVAWSDRWLARFAGAQPQSLDVFAAGSRNEQRTLMLAGSAPGAIFVAPSEAETVPVAAASTQSRSESRRYDDEAETPDDVLFAIAAAATHTRQRAQSGSAATVAAAARASAPVAPGYDPMVATSRETLADVVAHSAPFAPTAGLSAQLASSPFAPALRHILPLGTAPSFDVRSLFGSSVGATYLAGLLASPTDEISIASERAMTSIAPFETTRDVAGFEPTYIAPTADTLEAAGEGAIASPAAAAAPLTTLRSALLAFDVETVSSAPGQAQVSGPSFTTAASAASAPTLARSLLDTLSLPMLADTAAMREPGTADIAGATAHVPSYGAPGMIADRAQAWSVAQERSSADLAFDFVSPELVLAARVYGLGPAEAAQAARIAIAGPGQLTAMAGAVDRTFVQAMAIEAERRQGRSRITTAYPVALADGASVADAHAAQTALTGTSAASFDATSSYAASPYVASSSAFGVERRTPRGSFLWPAATTAALGLMAAAPDGELSMSVAALELLAAQAVAELGTYSALGENSAAGGSAFGGASIDRGALVSVAARATDGATAPSGAEASDEDVLASAAAFVPASRRDKFQALYLALSQSSSGRTASPAARAARALALAGRGEETINARERANVAWDVLPIVYGQQAREEAEMSSMSTGEIAQRMSRRREELRAMDATYVDGRPGLSHLSSRAGEALGSYVAPSPTAPAEARGSSSGSSRGEQGAVLRAPTAAPELVQTGRPAGRHGGGDLELPAWFEQAARKMLADRSGVAGDISLAELTLVTSAPAPQIAASSRVSSGSHSSSPSPAAQAGAAKQQVDIDKLANDVYREVLVLMDIARARNGEPYL